jgi:hypothetical protein
MAEIHLFQNDETQKALYFEPSYYAHLLANNDRHFVTITGSAKYQFEGKSTVVDVAPGHQWSGIPEGLLTPYYPWIDTTLYLHLIFPDIIPEKKWFKLENWAPFVTISGIDKGGDNHNGGWAVYDFGLDPGYTTIKPFKMPQGRIGLVSIWATVRVRGGLFDLFRIGYTLTVTGVLVDAQVEPIG